MDLRIERRRSRDRRRHSNISFSSDSDRLSLSHGRRTRSSSTGRTRDDARDDDLVRSRRASLRNFEPDSEELAKIRVSSPLKLRHGFRDQRATPSSFRLKNSRPLSIRDGPDSPKQENRHARAASLSAAQDEIKSRPLSPIRNPRLVPPSIPFSSDAKRILQLMKTTCGRMQGILSFRASDSLAWSSGYCAINVASGSLIHQPKGQITAARVLVTDLRGCQVQTLSDTQMVFMNLCTPRHPTGIHLRPHVSEAFDSWLAALLCWQPIRPRGVHNKMTKSSTRRRSAHFANSQAAIIKVGKMLMWTKYPQATVTSPLAGSRRFSTVRSLKPLSKHWRKVSCTLDENGFLKIFLEPESQLDSVIPLCQLSRCAVQRLNPSILDDEFSMAIYPRYTCDGDAPPSCGTVYLSLDTRVLFEVWFVLLQAYTVPELYGPVRVKDAKETDEMFRVERSLALRITEGRIQASQASSMHSGDDVSLQSETKGSYHAEVYLDAEPRARTAIKADTDNPFFREDFEFVNLPPVLTSSLIAIKSRNPSQKTWVLTRVTADLERGDMNPETIEGDVQSSPLDVTFGTVDLQLEEIDRGRDTEKWWPILDNQNENVGEMLMKIRLDELVVLTSRDYAPLLELLHNFSMTNQIAQAAYRDLKRLSEILLNIFQVSNQATAWLMVLVEEEIDTIHKETPMSKFRHGRRIASDDTYESSVQRELFLRDMGKNATIEANLLFRGNSLLTKALDSHMRRLGKEYLEDALSERMRDIAESNPDCEVDPNRIAHPDDLQRNWRNLVALTENVWRSIAASANRCPPELRIIMRRIRECAEDRYGGFLRTVAYSSVSGFLFLRFFCPAVLNPKLFGLLKEHPRQRAQRTFTLITKTLQTLANLSTFGTKEPWMEPMNIFLTSHRPEFKSFVDAICDINSESAKSPLPPSYATPTTILSRLPSISREGFLSLPYLIDQARECASLVDLWLDAKHLHDTDIEWTDSLRHFHDLCKECREKTKKILTKAEQAERPSGALEPKWEELVEQLEKKDSLRRPSVQIRQEFVSSYFPPVSPSGPRLASAFSPISPQSPLSAEESTEDISSATTDTPPRSDSEEHKDVEMEHESLGHNLMWALSSPASKRDSAMTNETVLAPASRRMVPERQDSSDMNDSPTSRSTDDEARSARSYKFKGGSASPRSPLDKRDGRASFAGSFFRKKRTDGGQ